MKAVRRSPQQISSQRGRSTLANALASACFSFIAISNAYDHPSRTPAYVSLWAIWMVVTIIWVFGVPGGFRFSQAERAIVNDELARSDQASAARFGFLVALLTLVAISLCGFARVPLPVWTVPAATSATITATGLFFAWLQMRND